MWRLKLFEARPGSEAIDVTNLVDKASWTSRLNGQGQGQHTLRMFGSGLSGAQGRELTRGNKYAIAQVWGSTVGYAGVLTDDDWDEESQTLVLQSKEMRAHFAPGRMAFGVNQYAPAGVALTITNRSHSGAVRAVLQAVQAPSSEWVMPIDLPADGAGTFSARWRFEETLTWENMLQQIEADGCEIAFRPYIAAGGQLRWQTIVAPKVSIGAATDLAARAPGSIVTGLRVKRSAATIATGVLAFGKGQGQDKPHAYAPSTGSGATDEPVRDVKVTYQDIEVPAGDTAAQARLQAAANKEYAARRYPVEQWSFGLHVYGLGPAIALPGASLRLWVHGSKRIADGPHLKRVVALAGDWGMGVKPEVQDG